MQIGQYEEFDENCGLAFIHNHETQQEWFVVYGDTKPDWDFPKKIISKGKTKEECLKNAIKYFMKREIVFESFLDEDHDSINNILRRAIRVLEHHQFTNCPEKVLPAEVNINDEIFNSCSAVYIKDGEALECID